MSLQPECHHLQGLLLTQMPIMCRSTNDMLREAEDRKVLIAVVDIFHRMQDQCRFLFHIEGSNLALREETENLPSASSAKNLRKFHKKPDQYLPVLAQTD